MGNRDSIPQKTFNVHRFAPYNMYFIITYYKILLQNGAQRVFNTSAMWKIRCKMWRSRAFPQCMGEKVENLSTRQKQKRWKKTQKVLDRRETDALYCLIASLSPQNRGRRSRKTPYPGDESNGGKEHEENVPAQEASAQGSPRLPVPYEHQERPQGHQCSPRKGPQEPDRLIRLSDRKLRHTELNKRRKKVTDGNW